jgi:hypothetical protein
MIDPQSVPQSVKENQPVVEPPPVVKPDYKKKVIDLKTKVKLLSLIDNIKAFCND